MIEDIQAHRTLHKLILDNNTVKFAKDVTKLLHQRKTPLVAYEEVYVFDKPLFIEPERIATQKICVGTAVDIYNTYPHGITCANTSSIRMVYLSKHGELVKREDDLYNNKRKLLILPMTGMERVVSTVSRCFPITMSLIEDAYTIERGEILEENHQIEGWNEERLSKIKDVSIKKYRPLLTAIASER